MRLLPTRNHGALDYLMGLALIAAPFVFGFATGGTPMQISIALGILLLAVSFLTDYEWGLVPFFVMPAHLGFELAIGVLLIASPFALEFPRQAWGPLLALGIILVALAVATESVPAGSRLAGRARSSHWTR
jgi:hypothetical protein